MKYMGSKNRIAKDIIPIMQKYFDGYEYYIEPFVGGCNLIDKIPNTIKKIGADNNFYLIEMWKALQLGWNPPWEISRELYNACREMYNNNETNYANLIGYIGFNGSYNGRFYDGGFAGIIKDKKTGKIRNYPLESYSNIMAQIQNIKDIKFIHSDYSSLKIPTKSIVYCDIPYKNTKKYTTSKCFDYDKFYEWCKLQANNGNKVFISEYDMPDDFKCIWQKEIKMNLKNDGNSENRTEKLFILD